MEKVKTAFRSSYNLGQNKMEQQTPSPPNQGWSRTKGKNAPFSHHWFWGEGGSRFSIYFVQDCSSFMHNCKCKTIHCKKTKRNANNCFKRDSFSEKPCQRIFRRDYIFIYLISRCCKLLIFVVNPDSRPGLIANPKWSIQVSTKLEKNDLGDATRITKVYDCSPSRTQIQRGAAGSTIDLNLR